MSGLNPGNPATAAPADIGTTNAVGSSTDYARGDHKHKITLATGDGNGQVKIAGTNVSVKGLQTTAYTTLANLWRVSSTNIYGNNAANSEKKQSPTAVSGYTPIGIIGWDAYADTKAITGAWRLRYNISEAKIVVAWASAVPTSAYLTVYMLYFKS